MATPVMFRAWKKKDGGGVIALFPTIPADVGGVYCQSYEHVGQHGGALLLGVIEATRPASPEEYAPLLQELLSIGYDLKVVKRTTSRMFKERMDALSSQYPSG